MAELKPCPFCGGRVYVSYWSGTQNFYIFHYEKKKCPVLEVELDGTKMQSLDDAIEAWNRMAEND